MSQPLLKKKSEGTGGGGGGSSRSGFREVKYEDNPPIPGKEWVLMTIVGPKCPQKSERYTFKVHDVCSAEQVKELGEHYRQLNDTDVFQIPLGAWKLFDDDVNNAKDINYIDNTIGEMLNDKRREHAKADRGFGKKVKDAMDGSLKGATSEERLVNKKEPAVVVRFKKEQLREHIRFRQNELDAVADIYYRNYSKAERKEAEKAELPLSKPAPFQFNQMSGLQEEDSSDEEEEDEEEEDSEVEDE